MIPADGAPCCYRRGYSRANRMWRPYPSPFRRSPPGRRFPHFGSPPPPIFDARKDRLQGPEVGPAERSAVGSRGRPHYRRLASAQQTQFDRWRVPSAICPLRTIKCFPLIGRGIFGSSWGVCRNLSNLGDRSSGRSRAMNCHWALAKRTSPAGLRSHFY